MSCENGFGEDFPQQAKCLWITRGIACHDLHFVLLLDIFFDFLSYNIQGNTKLYVEVFPYGHIYLLLDGGLFMEEERILREPHVWDLHIHTPLGTPTKKNYDGESNQVFISKLIEIYNNAPHRIGMISFTDHNQINVEAYNLFREKSAIAIIPGIEMDVYLSESFKDSKHVIFYFDESELDRLDSLNTLITDYIKEQNNRVSFDLFITHLLAHKKQFAISPHAFKQGKRGIDREWIDPESSYSGITGFSGLFFPFWEAAGKSEICKAQEFLQSEYNESSTEQSVIAFSDSSDYEKIKGYIEKPHQYFLCLDSYKGLLLAGSDSSRIIKEYENRPTSNPSEKIKSIRIKKEPKNGNNNYTNIELSDRLNVIIGGRGKGKSVLLDSIAYALAKTILPKSRKNFIMNFEPSIKNFNGSSFSQDIRFVYYHQAFITELFNGSSGDKLIEFFKEYFQPIDNIQISISDVLKERDAIKQEQTIYPERGFNIADNLHQLVIPRIKSKYFKLSKKKIECIPVFSESKIGYSELIKSVLPDSKVVWNEKVQQAFDDFIRVLLESIYTNNYENIISVQYSNLLLEKINEIQSNKDITTRKRTQSRKKLIEKLMGIYSKQLERVRQINCLYRIPKKLTEIQISCNFQAGEPGNFFYYIIAINKEHPVEYAFRIIADAIDKRKASDDTFEDVFSLYALEPAFCEKLKEQQTISNLQKEIDRLEKIRYEKISKIIYKAGTLIQDLHHTSPGTQTNAIMECIFHSDSTIPLLLDQPEDNIDNEARYQKLTKWIRKQKNTRQIIVVTHDANIVINGDAECVIIADHDETSFQYNYGALEYADTLDRASCILDGGKIAIKRRMAKYGE